MTAIVAGVSKRAANARSNTLIAIAKSPLPPHESPPLLELLHSDWSRATIMSALSSTLENSDWTACSAASVRANGESSDVNDCDNDDDIDGGSDDGDSDGDDADDGDEDTAVCDETFAGADLSLTNEAEEGLIAAAKAATGAAGDAIETASIANAHSSGTKASAGTASSRRAARSVRSMCCSSSQPASAMPFSAARASDGCKQ